MQRVSVVRSLFAGLLLARVVIAAPVPDKISKPVRDASEVWFPRLDDPKLTTPRWVGDEGVECVVVLAIDDMREPAKYETFLRPILQRLKAIDGRAAVSIMTCSVKPDDPQLQSWLQEGLSLECHTFDHPCPLLAGSDIAKSRSTYEKCIDLLASVPHNRPVAFRMPCCDSLNTLSPRFFSEIFNQTTASGHFLQLDSSVFTLYTAADPSIPRELVIDPDGGEKYRKYIPRRLSRGNQVHDRFVNTIENYPYPYVIRNTCWEFPCMVPSDWSANHLHQPNNPVTVRDLKMALDITVIKQGVMNVVFHPHGWIKAEQVVELIDHAVTTHGKKVKFLNFNECVERLNANVLGGRSLRDAHGADRGLRLRDADGDGSPEVEQLTPAQLADAKSIDTGRRFADIDEDGYPDLIVSNGTEYGVWLFDAQTNEHSICLLSGQRGSVVAENELPYIVRKDGSENGFFVRDRHLCWINEDTDNLPDFLQRIAFDDLMGDRLPTAKSPAAAIESMRVSPGYRIELVAHEPLTMDPIGLDWGADGKLWVVEMADYPQGIDGRGKPGGRVRFLQDTDGDGRYDTSTLFLDEIPFPSGVLAWKKGVLISAAPDIFYAEDTDGDGKADRRDVLYTGFAEGNQQHRVNGFTRGLDNWLYLANGDGGGIVKSVKSGESIDLRGRDLRIRPDSGAIEAIAGVSQFGRHRDDFDNWFGNNNSRPMWHYVLDDHYLRRNPFLATPNLIRDVSIAPGAAPVFPSSKTLTRFNDFNTANRFTSACGTIVYRDNLLFGVDSSVKRNEPTTEKAVAVSHVFVSEPVHNLVHHEVMTADGISFTSKRAPGEEQSEFVSSTDNWFRPTQVRTGPDGGLWIADMYRQVIEHPQWIPIEWQRKLDVRAGADRGRIWRVVPVGSTLRPIPRFDRLSTNELVAALDSPNGWQRDLVQQLLIDRADPAAIPLLRQHARSSNPLGRLHSHYALAGLPGGLTKELVTCSMNDIEPGIRRHAIRLQELIGEPDETAISALTRRVGDRDPQARLQLAYTLGEFKNPAAARLLGQLVREQGGDDSLVTAAMSSLNENNLALVLEEVISKGTMRPELLEQLLGQAAAFRNQPALVALLTRATEPTAEGNYAPWQFSAVQQFQVSLTRRGESLDAWLGDLDAQSNPIRTRLQMMLAVARKIVADPSTPFDERIDSIRVLGQSNDDLTLLGDLLVPQQPPELQSAALDGMARLKSPKVAEILLANYRSLGPNIRSRMCEVLLSRGEWQAELLSALESKRLTSSDIDATCRQRLLSNSSKAVRDRAAGLLSVNMNTDRAKLVADYLPVARAGGDAQHGSQLFARRCAQCHKLGQVGFEVGPDLASLTDKSAEALIAAVLDPNRAVEAKFMTFVAVTKAGVAHAGILASESASSLTLRAAEGKEVTLLRNEIDELQSSSKSLMPEGLERELTPADAAALVAYIRRNVPLPAMKRFPGNEPRVVRANSSGVLTLTPFDAEIYGPTIVLEEQHGNLGWWSSADDIVVWTIDVPLAGVYTVNWTWACDAHAAGNNVTLHAAGHSFTHPVSRTEGWDDYQTALLGEIELPAGEVRLTMKPEDRPLPALADVKSLVLKRSR